MDGGHRLKWLVRAGAGQQAEVPSVCFLLPPPDADAAEAVEKLKRLYEMSIMLWQRKQLRMRQNMIFATIKVVKSWDLEQVSAVIDAGRLCWPLGRKQGRLRRGSHHIIHPRAARVLYFHALLGMSTSTPSPTILWCDCGLPERLARDGDSPD